MSKSKQMSSLNSNLCTTHQITVFAILVVLFSQSFTSAFAYRSKGLCISNSYIDMFVLAIIYGRKKEL